MPEDEDEEIHNLFRSFYTLPVPSPMNHNLLAQHQLEREQMALPGLSLPGLGLTQQHPTAPLNTASVSGLPQSTRTEDLPPRTEWRFEVPFHQNYSIRLLTGCAELFGIELAANQPYTFSGTKAAIFTWQGCQLEISGEAESEYIGRETEYDVEWLNVHGMLETVRDDATAAQ